MSIEVYGRENCSNCKAVETYLTKRGVPYVKKHMDDASQEVIQKGGEAGVRSLPLVLVDGEVYSSGWNRSDMTALALASR